MPNRILIEDGWQDRVRNLLGVDRAYLEDVDIERPDIISVAEANIISRVPGYTDLDLDKRIWLESATVCECAALLCPTMKVRVPIREQGPHYTRDVEYDWDERRKELERERDVFLARLSTVDYISIPHFGRSKSR